MNRDHNRRSALDRLKSLSERNSKKKDKTLRSQKSVIFGPTLIRAKGLQPVNILEKLIAKQKKLFDKNGDYIGPNKQSFGESDKVAEVTEDGLELSINKKGFFTAKTEKTEKRKFDRNI